ncbi:MAG: hypothetical protein WC975_06830 [Phycisphaerae bacterium]
MGASPTRQFRDGNISLAPRAGEFRAGLGFGSGFRRFAFDKSSPSKISRTFAANRSNPHRMSIVSVATNTRAELGIRE